MLDQFTSTLFFAFLTPLWMQDADVSASPPKLPSSTTLPSSFRPSKHDAVISDQCGLEPSARKPEM